MRPDPMGQPRNPFQVFLFLLAIASGTPLLFGVTTVGSVEASLPSLFVIAWGLMLVLGSAATLAGMFWPWQPRTGLVLKRTGLTSVGFAAVAYAAILALYFGLSASLVVGTLAGFTVACFVQVRRIDVHIRSHLQDQGRP